MEVMFPIPVPGSHSNSGSVLSNDHTVDFITEKVEHQRISKNIAKGTTDPRVEFYLPK